MENTNKYYHITTTQSELDTIYSNNTAVLVGNKDNQKWNNAETEVVIKTKAGYTGGLSGVAEASKTQSESNVITHGIDWNQIRE